MTTLTTATTLTSMTTPATRRTRTTLSVIFLFLLFSGCTAKTDPEPVKHRIWFKEPAAIWEATLPLGNGHLGMMPDGGIHREKIVLNDITLWSGGPQDADNPGAAQYLPAIRELLFQGKNDEAQDLVYRHFGCLKSGSGHGNGTRVPYGSFETLGTLRLPTGATTLSASATMWELSGLPPGRKGKSRSAWVSTDPKNLPLL